MMYMMFAFILRLRIVQCWSSTARHWDFMASSRQPGNTIRLHFQYKQLDVNFNPPPQLFSY